MGLRSLIFGKGYRHRGKKAPVVVEPVEPEPPEAPVLSYTDLRPRLDEINRLDLDLDNRGQIEALFTKTSHYWRNTASEPQEIYFSVATEDRFRGVLTEEIKQDFFRSGRDSVMRIFEIYSEFNPGEPAPVTMDYGCGVARLAVHAAEKSHVLHCVDFSAGHLEEARRNLTSRGLTNINMIQLQGLSELESLPRCDLIYSLIVLQHNTPPVMAHTIRCLLCLLNSGGIAVLHIPLARPGYAFDADSYLGDDDSGNVLEMHILPKNNLNDLAAETNCRIVATYSYGGTGDLYSEWVVFQRQ